MVNFQFHFSPSPEQLQLEDDLAFIQNNITNPLQFALLNKRALRLFETRWIPGGARVKDILAVIRQIRTNISSIPLGSSNDPSLDRHKQFCEVLRKGTADLNSKKKRSRSRIETDGSRETAAIQRDEAEIKEAIRVQASLTKPPRTEIQIYKMGDPTGTPLTISENFMYYSEIAWHLFRFHRKFVSKPELWGRLRTQHGMGKHGYKWKIAEGTQRIEWRELDVVDMENRRSSNYIVALAHDKVTGQEIPLPIDVVNFYDIDNEAKRCCNPFCGNLRRHLQTVFPDRDVIVAKSLEDPSRSVIDMAFDTNQFPPRTNDLYLQWRPKKPV